MKHVVLIIDGASGWPAAALGGKTSLEAAYTPNLDRLAREGTVGVVSNVPDGMEASSAIACMSVMGLDPPLYYAGRGPIEAAAMGIELEPGQVAMRCNLVTVADGRMASYSAGNITSAESAELIAALQEGLGDERSRFYPGVGFRHILTVRDGAELLATRFTPPHDIAGRPVDESAPVGPGAAFARDLMERSAAILGGHPVNRQRLARGKPPATQIWLFWPGTRPAGMPAFAGLYGGRRAALTSPVDLLKGLAVQTADRLLADPGRHRTVRTTTTRGRCKAPWPPWAITTSSSCTWSRPTRRATPAMPQARWRPSSRSTPLWCRRSSRPRRRRRRTPAPASGRSQGPRPAGSSHPPGDPDPCGRARAVHHVGPRLRSQRGGRLYRERGPGHGLRRGAGPPLDVDVPRLGAPRRLWQCPR